MLTLGNLFGLFIYFNYEYAFVVFLRGIALYSSVYNKTIFQQGLSILGL